MHHPTYFVTVRVDEGDIVELSEVLYEHLGEDFGVMVHEWAHLSGPGVAGPPLPDFGRDLVVRLCVGGPDDAVQGLVAHVREHPFMRAQVHGLVTVERTPDLTEADVLIKAATTPDDAGARRRAVIRHAVRTRVRVHGGAVIGERLHLPSPDEDALSVLTPSPESLRRDLVQYLPDVSTAVREK
ncbi:hypothetical protein EDD29_4313 [Actinocorallia herbida]|uniref:Uncharacterized protein n=1 Tax=Actinocorallia herbida TaxID=58109 RepID=A0A3N1CZN0_9ACTN|nr:hypothetical protein [Actinocorallia herbida]ROO86735.1 hypothetical protein EDD29_4313 [Actinocorallia herbida]